MIWNQTKFFTYIQTNKVLYRGWTVRLIRDELEPMGHN